jgi:hypothetical protein
LIFCSLILQFYNCNIHPHMTAYLKVVDSRRDAVTDGRGEISLIAAAPVISGEGDGAQLQRIVAKSRFWRQPHAKYLISVGGRPAGARRVSAVRWKRERTTPPAR